MEEGKKRGSVLAACVGKSCELAGLVSYADDSVVSKAIIDKEVGTVTLFAFDKGQQLSEHTTPYDAMVQVVDGEGVFTVGGEAITVGAGGVLIMPGGVAHSVSAEERFKMLLTMIRQG
jgi:quercetin dioxygenase-like cupin family protein